MNTIKKLLIANRGEIALRIMRSAKEMGIKTVAVYSEADTQALHVKYADEAYCIGPAPSNQSYLKGETIIKVAKESGCEAIHPGYGFLSENSNFARMVENNGLILVGPSPMAMDLMGSKLSAKQLAKQHNIPLVPGTEEAITDINEAKTIASSIGYPILIKASAGGGGKGMRIVNHDSEFEEQMQLAASEALASFGDGSVFIERYVASPRHIEIQILGDKHGNYVYLFERECSIQRRHQKVVEEAPSSVLTPEIREAMGNCAVAISKACNYSGAGTVEFLLDENLNFYFLEMNTRLQVEHPVSEFITGIDLVQEQIKVAAGQKLSFSQKDLRINGHSIEIRVYAEDPSNNFLPDIGKLNNYKIPQGNGIRVDDAFEKGMSIPIYYDPMIAKLIVHAPTREAAIKKMTLAINDYKITGIKTTLGFCKWAINHNAFVSGNFDTHFVKNFYTPELLEESLTPNETLAVALSSISQLLKASPVQQNVATETISNWKLRR
jgi:acetyl-CoA carboxylase biotin carboxylase subunit